MFILPTISILPTFALQSCGDNNSNIFPSSKVAPACNEITSLQKVGRQTFFETFSQTNTEENMQKYLEEEGF